MPKARLLRRSSDLAAALDLLVYASEYAEDTHRDIWDYAVEMRFLLRAGLTVSDFRWLVYKGFVEHGIEVRDDGTSRRIFRRSSGTKFGRRSCFVLTPAGLEFVRSLRGTLGQVNAGKSVLAATTPPSPDKSSGSHPRLPLNGRAREEASPAVVAPHWDSDYREIRYQDRVVKQFKLPSPNQEAILLAFEEEGWPPRIDDPLSPLPHCDPKQRLHDTIRSLNRNQKNRLLRFKGDGTGQGVLWEPVPEGNPVDLE